jgi:hypothetical protein
MMIHLNFEKSGTACPNFHPSHHHSLEAIHIQAPSHPARRLVCLPLETLKYPLTNSNLRPFLALSSPHKRDSQFSFAQNGPQEGWFQ